MLLYSCRDQLERQQVIHNEASNRMVENYDQRAAEQQEESNRRIAENQQVERRHA